MGINGGCFPAICRVCLNWMCCLKYSGSYSVNNSTKIILVSSADTITASHHYLPIVTGSLRVNDCPAESQIPIFLIVAGLVLVLKNTLSLVQQVKRYRQDNAEEQTKKHPGEGIIDAFLLIWFIAGRIIIHFHLI